MRLLNRIRSFTSVSSGPVVPVQCSCQRVRDTSNARREEADEEEEAKEGGGKKKEKEKKKVEEEEKQTQKKKQKINKTATQRQH